ncbi:MAG: hypothetical protein ACLFWM_09235, partial [Actinomycetota bacterium]
MRGDGAAGGRVLSRARRLWELLRRGEIVRAGKQVRKLIWSTTTEYAVRKDLSVPVEVEPARIPIRVRPLEPRDLDRLFDPRSGDSAVQLWRQRRLLDAGIPGCWVAVDRQGDPCFMVWLVHPDQNEAMRQEFGAAIPPLEPDEVLMESGFTPQRYRSQRIGPEALSRILQTVGPETRWAVAYT